MGKKKTKEQEENKQEQTKSQTERDVKMEVKEIYSENKFVRKFRVKFESDTGKVKINKLILQTENEIPELFAEHYENPEYWVGKITIEPHNEKVFEVICFYELKSETPQIEGEQQAGGERQAEGKQPTEGEQQNEGEQQAGTEQTQTKAAGPEGQKTDKPEDETAESEKAAPDEEIDEKPQYSFPTKSRCPRCKSLDTIAKSTQGKIQYRECSRAICRWKYTVIGTRI